MGKTYAEFENERITKEQQILNQYLSTRVGREAYARAFNLDLQDLEEQYGTGALYNIPPEVFSSFYDPNPNNQNLVG